MYEKALATNQRLKSRLEISKQELAMIQEQLQRAQVIWLKVPKKVLNKAEPIRRFYNKYICSLKCTTVCNCEALTFC